MSMMKRFVIMVALLLLAPLGTAAMEVEHSIDIDPLMANQWWGEDSHASTVDALGTGLARVASGALPMYVSLVLRDWNSGTAPSMPTEGVVSAPVAAVPWCIAYNVTSSGAAVQLSPTPRQLALLLTGGQTAIYDAISGGYVSSASLSLVPTEGLAAAQLASKLAEELGIAAQSFATLVAAHPRRVATAAMSFSNAAAVVASSFSTVAVVPATLAAKWQLPCMSVITDYTDTSGAVAGGEHIFTDPNTFEVKHDLGSSTYIFYVPVVAHFSASWVCQSEANGQEVKNQIEFYVKEKLFSEVVASFRGAIPSPTQAAYSLGKMVNGSNKCIGGQGTAAAEVSGSGIAQGLLSNWLADTEAPTAAASSNWLTLQEETGTVLVAKAKATPFFSVTDRPLLTQQEIDVGLKQIALAAYPIAIMFNVPGALSLAVPRCTLVDIFTGQTTFWDAQALQEANPSIVMPHEAIKVFVPQSNGVVFAFTQGLHNLSLACRAAGRSTQQVGVSSSWEISSAGATAIASGWVASKLRQTRWSIGVGSWGEAVSGGFGQRTASLLDEAAQMARAKPPDRASELVVESTSIEGKVEISSVDRYPFIGAVYAIFDANVDSSQQLGDCTSYSIVAKFLEWVVQSNKAAEVASRQFFLPFPSKVSDKSREALSTAKCDGTYALQRPAEKTSNTLTIVLVVIGSVVVCALAAAVVFALRSLRKKQAVATAPQDSSQPFAAMFLSVEDEALLWEGHPNTAARAIDEVVGIIKGAIVESGCYEAKRIGAASFFVTAVHVSCVCNCAALVQSRLRGIEWSKLLPFSRRKDSMSTPSPSTAPQEFGANQRSVGSYPDQSGEQQLMDESVNSHPGSDSLDLSAQLRRPSESGSILSKKSHSSSINLALSFRMKKQKKRTTTVASLASGSTGDASRSVECDRVYVKVGIHWGHGVIEYEKHGNMYKYSGTVVDVTAGICDFCQGGQILMSYDAATQIDRLQTMDFAKRTIEKIDVDVMQYNPPGHPVMYFEPPTTTEEMGRQESLSASLKQTRHGITSKVVTVLSVYIEALHDTSRNLSNAAFCDHYKDLTFKIADAVKDSKGQFESFCGGRVVASFNAAAPCPHQLLRAFTVARAIQEMCPGNVYCGIASGSALVGQFNTSGSFSHFGIVGHAVDNAAALERLARQFASDVRVLSTSWRLQDVETFVEFQYVDILKEAGAGTAVLVAALMDFDNAGGDGDEWMYEVEDQMMRNPYIEMNNIFLDLVKTAEIGDGGSSGEGSAHTKKSLPEVLAELAERTSLTAFAGGQKLKHIEEMGGVEAYLADPLKVAVATVIPVHIVEN